MNLCQNMPLWANIYQNIVKYVDRSFYVAPGRKNILALAGKLANFPQDFHRLTRQRNDVHLPHFHLKSACRALGAKLRAGRRQYRVPLGLWRWHSDKYALKDCLKLNVSFSVLFSASPEAAFFYSPKPCSHQIKSN